LSVQDEGQRLAYLSIWMRRDRNLKLQRRGRGDFDFELGAHFSLHSADDAPVVPVSRAVQRRRVGQALGFIGGNEPQGDLPMFWGDFRDRSARDRPSPASLERPPTRNYGGRLIRGARRASFRLMGQIGSGIRPVEPETPPVRTGIPHRLLVKAPVVKRRRPPRRWQGSYPPRRRCPAPGR